MAEKNHLYNIATLCHQLDERAARVYEELATLCEDDDREELRQFWVSMRDDEKDHMDVWDRIATFAEEGILPEIFGDPVSEKKELDEIFAKIAGIEDAVIEDPTVANMFTTAYRLEFYLMHPVFEQLFNLMETLDAGYAAEDLYESHLTKFIHYLKKYGKQTPELDLLGETLFRLWSENRKLAVLSSTDELTGLLNRRGFYQAVKPLLHLAQRNGNHVSFMICDLDDFKKVNDSHGHQAGDRVLRRVATVLEQSVRASDVVGRYGGEEFIICFSTIGKSSVIRLAEKIREAVRKETAGDIPVTISIGVAGAKLGIDVDADMDKLIGRADSFMLDAKSKGKDQVMSELSQLEPYGD
ncbi:MAG: GGDEF domain-containing protein [Gaiellales bacterium]|nr:MAG: GGDEF domain-containing protein [Gaiellales bacterium]